MRPSDLVSQNALAAEAIAAPLFYWIMQVTTYLNFLFNLARSLMQDSIIYWHHWLTFSR